MRDFSVFKCQSKKKPIKREAKDAVKRMNDYIYRFLVGGGMGWGNIGVRAQAPMGNIALAKGEIDLSLFSAQADRPDFGLVTRVDSGFCNLNELEVPSGHSDKAVGRERDKEAQERATLETVTVPGSWAAFSSAAHRKLPPPSPRSPLHAHYSASQMQLYS